mmetsp:Transcript_9551/g.34118  ORF Transcript_9551/g.34118 Transcript_9551/m.34118 type:complete len:201 (-) Transcript_9551:1048-1650(-)
MSCANRFRSPPSLLSTTSLTLPSFISFVRPAHLTVLRSSPRSWSSLSAPPIPLPTLASPREPPWASTAAVSAGSTALGRTRAPSEPSGSAIATSSVSRAGFASGSPPASPGLDDRALQNSPVSVKTSPAYSSPAALAAALPALSSTFSLSATSGPFVSDLLAASAAFLAFPSAAKKSSSSSSSSLSLECFFCSRSSKWRP